MSHQEPSEQEAITLFQSIERDFPKELGEDKWYILTVAALTASPHPQLAATLYTHLISQPANSSSEARQALIRRLREALFKTVPIIGIPKALEAIFSIAAIERPEDRDLSFSREGWKSGTENIARGKEWLAQIYRQNHAATESVLANHKDFMWVTEEITYGLYLSDQSTLGPVETELVVVAGLAMQDMPRETGWHLRGIRRIGVDYDAVEVIQQQIEKVAKLCGVELRRIPRVKDIEHEVPWDSGA